MTVRYLGMNSQTGLSISEIKHIRQSVRDILVTPIGSRVMRREYGSLLSALIHQPPTPALRLQIMAACYSASDLTSLGGMLNPLLSSLIFLTLLSSILAAIATALVKRIFVVGRRRIAPTRRERYALKSVSTKNFIFSPAIFPRLIRLPHHKP